MDQNFSYKILGAKELLETFCIAYEKQLEHGRVVLSNGPHPDYTQYLKLPTDIEVLLSEYIYNEELEITHYAESDATRAGDLALWLDLADTTSQQYSLIDQKKSVINKKQHQCILLNNAYTYSLSRAAGCKGKSIIIFLPAALMSALFNKDYLNIVVENYYAMQCRGLQLETITTTEENKILSVFHQWNENKNLVSITKNIHQLIEWFFTKMFKKFDSSGEDFKLTMIEKNDLMAIEAALKLQVTLASPDIEALKKLTLLSMPHLEEKFKNIYGETIHQYFKKLKFIQSKIYLKDGRSVAETAYELGYANPSNFSASFKKIYNITPEDYRKQLTATT